MKIVQITTIKLRYTMDLPMADAIHFMPERPLLIVQVHTDTGLTGMGEAATYGGDLESIEAMVTGELARAIIGQDPFEVERLWQRMAMRSHQRGTRGALMMAISGIDIALWDIIGQATGTPLYRLLGGYRETLTAYASAGFYAKDKNAAALAEETAGYVDRGITWLKIKVGRNPDVEMNPLHNMIEPNYATATLEEDVERVRSVREAVGPTVKIAIDANNAWTAPVALNFMRQVESLGIAWLEEPVATEDRRGSAEVARMLDTPVSGYETETGLAGFRDLILSHAVDIVQPDVIWTGGITPCRKIAALAEAFALPVIPHVFSSGLSTIANMHFIASIPNGGLLECDHNPNPLRSELFEEPITIESDGTVRMPDEPGLGVRLNQDTVEKYRVEH
ncbi:MAG: mandelate racemase/muconate lactonizing enzyme family protein [Thermomicrobiales bacterium]